MIAASAKTHYRVTKIQDSKRTTAQIEELMDDARVQEIARMTSGDYISDTSVSHAKELLKHSTLKKKTPKKPSQKSKK